MLSLACNCGVSKAKTHFEVECIDIAGHVHSARDSGPVITLPCPNLNRGASIEATKGIVYVHDPLKATSTI